MEPNTRLKPVKEFRFYKRNLPHFENPGNFYFINFRTTEGFTLPDAAKDVAFTSIKYHANKKYKLYACIVMETHVHCVLQPLEESIGTYYSLAQIMHSIKSYSSHKINKLLNRTSNVWLDENYDRIIRDEEDYLEKMNYIIYNSVKAGLVEKPEDYRWMFYEGSG